MFPEDRKHSPSAIVIQPDPRLASCLARLAMTVLHMVGTLIFIFLMFTVFAAIQVYSCPGIIPATRNISRMVFLACEGQCYCHHLLLISSDLDCQRQFSFHCQPNTNWKHNTISPFTQTGYGANVPNSIVEHRDSMEDAQNNIE